MTVEKPQAEPIPAEIRAELEQQGLTDIVRNPIYATGVGLLQYGAQHMEEGGSGGGRAAASGAGADPMGFTSDWHRAVIEDFAECLRMGRAPMVPGRSALGVHRLIAALERSAAQGTRVSVED